MPSPSELLSRGFSLGKDKNAKLASIAAGLNASGRYSRRGNNRRANEAKAQAMLKYFTNSEKKAEKTGKDFTKAFYNRRNFTRNLAASLARSPSGSRASSPASSRASSRGSRSNRGPPALAAAGANKAKRTYTRKSRAAPPASGTWPLLKKSRQLWTVKVIPSKSRGKATVSKLTGKEGGKLLASSHNVTAGKAGRSVLQQALHEAEGAFENKVADGYTEVRSVHRSTNNELKSINNFVPN